VSEVWLIAYSRGVMDQARKQKDRTWTHMSRGGGGGPWSFNVWGMKLGTLGVVQVGGWGSSAWTIEAFVFNLECVIYLIFRSCFRYLGRVWRQKIGPELTCPGVGGGGPWASDVRCLKLGTLTVSSRWVGGGSSAWTLGARLWFLSMWQRLC